MKLGYDSTSSGGELSLVLFLIDLLALALYSPFALIFVAIKSHEYLLKSHDCCFFMSLVTFLKIKSIEVYCTLPLWRFTDEVKEVVENGALL